MRWFGPHLILQVRHEIIFQSTAVRIDTAIFTSVVFMLEKIKTGVCDSKTLRHGLLQHPYKACHSHHNVDR